jgi:hypothetical protein
MKTLIIPDVHENIFAVQRIFDAELDFDYVVFLGDWFDRFSNQPGDALATARWLSANQADHRFTFLFGNHDIPYAFPPRRGLLCSGYQYHIPALLGETGVRMAKYFVFYTRVGRYLLSHAGFTPELLAFDGKGTGDRLSGTENIALASLADEQSRALHPWLAVGWSRGGDQSKGGCTWLDWNDEFEDVPGIPQIIGHTKSKEPRWKGENLCLDTAMRHYGVIIDGERVIVKEVPKYLGLCGGNS